ncbi:cytidine deaminase [Ferruginibacter sp.]|uniref:cytidine deaminase n=1 Tax=Ferruginibacter sp. TaxID=1940288 RepID=UPI00374DEBC7
MIKKEIPFAVEIYASAEELNDSDATLLAKARAITTQAYAPYSHFNVGAAAMLTDGTTVTATNQENASYPVGICAERVLLSAVASQFTGRGIIIMAISYHNINGKSNTPISPCGICRQSLAEYEERTHQSIRLILSGMLGEVYIIEKAQQLLPLTFSAVSLK